MSSDWWAKKMGGQPQARPPLPPLTPPAAPVRPAPAPAQQNVQVTGENIAEAAMGWRGGEATRTETQACPQCGSDLFFSRTNSGGMVGMQGSVTPAPRCYSCGYTQGHQQQGMPPS